MASELDLDIDRDPWKDSRTSNAPYLNKAPGEYPSLRKKCEFSLDNMGRKSAKAWG